MNELLAAIEAAAQAAEAAQSSGPPTQEFADFIAARIAALDAEYEFVADWIRNH